VAGFSAYQPRGALLQGGLAISVPARTRAGRG
jgi:hypothetical protein